MDHISGDRQDSRYANLKPFMDPAMMRKPGNMGIISRSVCVTSSGALRSGVHGNGHAPFWSSGRWSDPPLDCNTRILQALMPSP